MKLISGQLKSTAVYMVGIKGSGMAALAELLSQEGAQVHGSDIPQEFYTDAILRKNNIPFYSGFSAVNVPSAGDCDLVVYSAAYNPSQHPELLRAAELGLPLMQYPEALGQYSASLPFAAVAGVHGKTTTTAMMGTMVKHLDLHGKVLVGSAVSNFGGSPTFSGGNDFFIAETCEYRRHFLNFNPAHVLITSIEADHLDYFTDADDVASAFCQLMDKLPPNGTVVYCADDPGAAQCVESYFASTSGANQNSIPSASSRNLRAIPYGFSATGRYAISGLRQGDGVQEFLLEGYSGTLRLRYPGVHSVRNAAGALALLEALLGGLSPQKIPAENELIAALESFSGTTRRSEIIADIDGIRILDDYAHHPAAIQTTLDGYRKFYPGRRIIVDFMSHTYSRSSALLEEFAASFSSADVLILNNIYASAREKNESGIDGEQFYKRIAAVHPQTRYCPDFDDAVDAIAQMLRPGDLVVTMGAGDNWTVGTKLRDILRAQTEQENT